MTLKEMREAARKAFEEKHGSNVEYIETVGNKGVEHVNPKDLPKPEKKED